MAVGASPDAVTELPCGQGSEGVQATSTITRTNYESGIWYLCFVYEKELRVGIGFV